MLVQSYTKSLPHAPQHHAADFEIAADGTVHHQNNAVNVEVMEKYEHNKDFLQLKGLVQLVQEKVR